MIALREDRELRTILLVARCPRLVTLAQRLDDADVELRHVGFELLADLREWPRRLDRDVVDLDRPYRQR
jgi:hypothetical protein